MSTVTFYRVVFFPRIPSSPFEFPVITAQEGAQILTAISLYDQFLVDHKFSPDIANCGWVEKKIEGQEWEEIHD